MRSVFQKDCWLKPRPAKPIRFDVRSNRSPMYAPLFWSSNSCDSTFRRIVCESLRNLNITWFFSRATSAGSLGNRTASTTASCLGDVVVAGVPGGGFFFKHEPETVREY